MSRWVVFNEGYAAVRKDGKWFHMYVGEFHDGQAFVTDGLPCIINDKGEFVFDGANSGERQVILDTCREVDRRSI